MNISPSALEAWGGQARDDRPQYVDDALKAKRKVGYGEGLPLVSADDHSDVEITDDTRELYDYPRHDDLLLPSTGETLRELCEQPEITSVNDLAAELGMERDTRSVRKALDLHGIEAPSGDTEGSDAPEGGADGFELPSGETVPASLYDTALHSPLILAALASAGMSLEEIAAYIERETGNPTAVRDVRECCQNANLL